MTQRIVNDFSITVGTANGSGSQTSNVTILYALFKMGIPVSGKNLLPSNIQGLPTWYTIRVNKDGFTARRDEQEIVVAINPASFVRDLANVAPGGVFYYDDSIKLPVTRDDITAYAMPVKELVRKNPNVPSTMRDQVGNMVYVGVLAQMLGIDLEKINAALSFHFKGKQQPTDLNFNIVKAAAEWAKEVALMVPSAAQTLRKTAYAIWQRDRTPDGYFGPDWDGVPGGQKSRWTREGVVAQQSMTSASAANVLVAAASLP